MKERCDLLAKAQSLAVRRGLDETKVQCPFLDVCKGTKCHMFDSEEMEENIIIAEDLRRCSSSREGIISDFLEETEARIKSGEITYDQAPQQYKERVGR
jgi:hypothetical protein